MRVSFLAYHRVVIVVFTICFVVIVRADVQVNSADNAAPNLGNYTTESEVYVAKSGSLAVVGYNTSRQAGLLGAGSWTSLSGYAYSQAGGSSFTDAGFVPSGSYTLEGDPTLAFDRNGNLYYGSLLADPGTGHSYIGVSQSTSTSPTVTFGNPVLIAGQLSTSGGFEDKEFLAVDNSGGPYDGRVYVAWSEFPPSGNPQALFVASSSTSPLTFSPAIALAPLSSAFQHGTVPAVGPDGSVYVAWSTLSSYSTAASATINLVKSTNGGASFINPDPSDSNASKTVASFTSTVADVGTAGQSLRTRSFPYLAIDQTPAGSPTRGNLYIVFQARPSSSTSPRSEIFFTSSTDQGKTWSTARDITSGLAATIGQDSTNNDNWLPSISVSPVTGHIKVLLYSRREDTANQKIRVYEAGSTDAGMTWYNQPFSAVAFTPSDGYDPLLVPNYMGDYLYAVADSSGLLGAWGDTRNPCTPPSSATAPCSPTARGDQDVWSASEADATGVDLAITPWGAATGNGPLWQTPDIFVVDASNAQVNAELGIINNLRARIRNLGNANATGATVRFRFAPIYGSVPDSAFELIGTVTVNAPAASAPQDVPINWDLTNLNDTNGGIWPNPISFYSHFCVRVDIQYTSDINLSNNNAQNNFVDVTAGSAPIKPIRFLIGNPHPTHPVRAQIVTHLPEEFRRLIKEPRIKTSIAKETTARTTVTRVAPGTIPLKTNEIQEGTVTLERPPASLTRRLDHDIVADVNTVIDNRVVGGFSVLLARANVTPTPTPASRSIRVVSKQVGQAAPSEPPQPPRTFELTASLASEKAHQSVVEYLSSQKIAIAQNDPQRGLVSSGAVPLTHQQLLQSIRPESQRLVRGDTEGRYYLSIKTTPVEKQGVTNTSQIVISVRIIANAGNVDSPLGGRLVPSNGRIEQRYLEAFNTRFGIR